MTEPGSTGAPDPLGRLTEHGVAIWLDDLSRDRLSTGTLRKLVDERHVVGITSNPTIFHLAITKSSSYDDQLADHARRGSDADSAVRDLTTDDVRAACDLLAPVVYRTGGRDGRVSLEVDPRLARDTQATIEQARDLWPEVDRPNLFIKIPATHEERRLAAGGSVDVARLAYQAYQEVVATERWRQLEAAGARRQRPLWASTGTKNPDYSDTLYVTELVAPETVNTMPEATLDAAADHGVIRGDTR